MEQLSSTIGETMVENAVAARQAELGGSLETSRAFTAGVEKKVQEDVMELQQQFGGQVDAIAHDAMQEAESYAAAQEKLRDPDTLVGNIAESGAAGMNMKDDNTIVIDTASTDADMDAEAQAYWERVHDHEQYHQQNHAGEFNASEIVIPEADGGLEADNINAGNTVSVTAMVEGSASSAANEESDLTDEYRDHVKNHNEVVDLVGKDVVDEALASGDVEGLQEEVDTAVLGTPEERVERAVAAQTEMAMAA